MNKLPDTMFLEAFKLSRKYRELGTLLVQYVNTSDNTIEQELADAITTFVEEVKKDDE